MIDKLAKFFKPIASLKLTIFCLACALVLITVGTLDQVNIGIFEAQNRYFKSFFLYFPLPGTDLKIPWFFGGYTIGGILLINLIAAHVARFKFTWKKAGIVVLHSGLILLLIGQLLTSLFQVESQMRLDQGEARNYSESFYHDELAIIDTSAPGSDQVISIPDSKLRKGNRVSLPLDSLEVALGDYYPNSVRIVRRWQSLCRWPRPISRTSGTCRPLRFQSFKMGRALAPGIWPADSPSR